MSASSRTFRWLSRMTRDSNLFFYGFAAVLGSIPGTIGYLTMKYTTSYTHDLEARLRQSADPKSLLVGQVNTGRMNEFLAELQRKDETNDRYVAALHGNTLVRNPYVLTQQDAHQSVMEDVEEKKEVRLMV